MQHSLYKRIISYSSAILCITACAADLILIYVLGKQIPGFNQLTHTLSSLGVSGSPVAGIVSIWSVILGVVFVFFAFGFRNTFRAYGKQINKVFWLIILYGLGEGVASGIFRIDILNGRLTNMAVLHEFLGGIGVTALLLLPLVMRTIFTAFSYPLFFRFSGIVFALGLISIFLFSFRLEYFAGSFLYKYCGVWQRIFLVNSYVYLTVIAFKVMRGTNQIKSKVR